MGTVSIIIGLIVFAIALFPNLGYFIMIPAAVGLILGLCKLVRDGYCPWSLSGIVLNGMAILLAFFWTGLISLSTTDMMEDAIRDIQSRPDVMQIFYPIIPDNHPAKKALHHQSGHTGNAAPAAQNTAAAPKDAAAKAAQPAQNTK